MKLNRKGFTLIELLAVVVILALVLILVFPNSIDVFKKAKLKSEEEFLDRLSQSIDSYISLNADEINFTDDFTGEKIKTNPVTNEKTKLPITGKMGIIGINDIINDELILESDFINPNNKEESCKSSTSNDVDIEVYKDIDSVYCHKIKVKSLPCLTNEYIEKLKEKQNTNDPYAIDTCIWTASSEEESE